MRHNDHSTTLTVVEDHRFSVSGVQKIAVGGLGEK
jgi:hypothetical protein